MKVKNVNIYIVPKQTAKGGDFYKLYINRNEKLDLTNYLSDMNDDDNLEALIQQEDETFKPVGGIILKKGEVIGSSSVYSSNDGEISLDSEEQDEYLKWLELENKSLELYHNYNSQIQNAMEYFQKISEEIAEVESQKQILTQKMRVKFDDSAKVKNKK